MLQQLSISNFILVEKCQMNFGQGLCVLTGETGAGKSILLGALGLLLGERAAGQPLFDTTQPATLNAEFKLSDAIRHFCETNGLQIEDDSLLLRRQILPDGKSRAFINDQPISISLLKILGEQLVEVHGQQGQRALTDKATQRAMLDKYGKHEAMLKKIEAAFSHWKKLENARAAKQKAIENAAEREDYLRHIHSELSKLNPQTGEEEELAVKRRQLMQAEKLGGLLNEVQSELDGSNPVEDALSRASRLLARTTDDKLENKTLDNLLESLDAAQESTAEALQYLDSLILDSGYDPKELDSVETRLFELRGAARKHKRTVDELTNYLSEIDETLKALDSDESALTQLLAEEKIAKEAYEKLAVKLSEARKKVATTLADKVMEELKPLRMEATRFKVAIVKMESEHWGAQGFDSVQFEASTNQGVPFGALAKIASGGELSRFMLAMKVVLAEHETDKTLIFDEIDTGTSGVVAEAIGERLSRLGKAAQVMCITHLPQVASKGVTHFKVAKASDGEHTRTSVTALNDAERREELATMLSGKIITDEARKQADTMLKAAS